MPAANTTNRQIARIPVLGFNLLAAFLIVTFSEAVHSQDGKTIYQDQCADCHGEKGEGVEGAYEQRLSGVLTLFELENYITKTMPEGDEHACVGDDSKSVAKFIYDQFYSIEAQNRISPPKYVFSRLTNVQYRNAVSDILSSFLNRQDRERPKKHGLRGIYYASRSMRKSKMVNDRIDPKIDFDFGEGSPEKVEGKEFSIRWSGSLIAEESGEYTIIVESANSVRLRLNTARKPLVDANVVSGEKATYKGTVHLLQGRLYNLSIDVSRFKEKKGLVKLSWIRPNGYLEVIPATNYCTNRVSPLVVLETKFPPDDESYGYARGISISKEWANSVSKAAIEAGQVVNRYFDVFVRPEKDPQKRKEIAKQFCQRVAELAFRKKLTPESKKLYVDSFFTNDEVGLRDAVKRSIVLIFKSPRFLYLDLKQSSGTKQHNDSKKPHLDPAFRLARVYWDSVPSTRELDASNKGQFIDNQSANWIFDRMIEDYRTEIKLKQFFARYLKLHALHSLEKDTKLFPGFDKQMVEDLKRSMHLQFEEWIRNKEFSFSEIFTSQSIFANQRIADFYGLDWPKEAASHATGYQQVPVQHGGGILTHPLLMSGFSYASSTSPIHRGVFVAQNIIGRRLNPPPDAFPPFDGEIAKTWTTREKVSYQTKPDSCQRCHGLINDLGFAFEAFDAVGKTRKLDNQKPINSKGNHRTESGKLIKYEGADELASFLSQYDSVKRHFVEELFQFMVKQPLAAYGPEARKRLMKTVSDNGNKLRPLLIEIGKVAAFIEPNR